MLFDQIQYFYLVHYINIKLANFLIEYIELYLNLLLLLAVMIYEIVTYRYLMLFFLKLIQDHVRKMMILIVDNLNVRLLNYEVDRFNKLMDLYLLHILLMYYFKYLLEYLKCNNF